MRGADAASVAAALRNKVFRFTDEAQLHQGIAAALAAEAIDAEHEVRLGPRDRPDFLTVDGGVAIEAKVGGSAAAVDGQLQRYAQSDRVRGMVLVTACARHAGVGRCHNGKPVVVVATFGGAL